MENDELYDQKCNNVNTNNHCSIFRAAFQNEMKIQ